MKQKTKYRWWLVGLLLWWLAVWPTVTVAQEGLRSAAVIPYQLGSQRIAPQLGAEWPALVKAENRSPVTQTVLARLELPPGIVPARALPEWQTVTTEGRTVLQRSVVLPGGYSQWFDVVPLRVAPAAGAGTYAIVWQVGEDRQQYALTVEGAALTAAEPLRLATVWLPLDREGRQDERMERNTLVLRDRQLDYYKNLLRGKGASDQEIEAIHPVTHMAVEIENPGRQQKLVTIRVQLLHKTTRETIPGLFTPGTSGEDKNAGALGGHTDQLVVFAGLTGEEKQRILIPVYADEHDVKGGEYWLRVSVDDGSGQLVQQETPLVIVQKNNWALGITGIACLLLSIALTGYARRVRRLLAGLPTRSLVTIALFGAAAFAIVTVPATLLNDVFHALLGPFGFLVTGLFSSSVLYMLILSLVMLLPRPGIVSLMALVRFLLGMLAFGHLSPILVLSYGCHAFLLEGALYVSRWYRVCQAETGCCPNWRQRWLLAFWCSLADGTATYIGLQAMATLYRLYYADWYIGLVLLCNGLVYTVIGVMAGIVLGNKLRQVGGE